MNRKQLLLLVAVALVLGGLGYWVNQNRQRPYEESSRALGQKLFPNFPLNDVAQISVQGTNSQVHLVRTGEQWTVKERAGYPANFTHISEFLRKIYDLKVTKPLKVGPSRLPQLGLLAPDKGGGTRVSFKDEVGKELHSLLLGVQHSRETPGNSPFGGGAFPDGRYLMVGDDIKTASLVADPLTVEAKPEDWLHKDFFKIEEPKTISVTALNSSNSWSVTRTTAGAEWTLAKPQGDEALDTSKASSLNYAFGSPSFADVVVDPKPEQTGLDKPTKVEIETFDGLKYLLNIGNAATNGDNVFLQVSVSGTPAKERAPAADEKPEDKGRLDQEFASKKTATEEKLSKMREFTKWTYLVPKYVVDAVLKERREVLVDKNAPKPDAAGAPRPGQNPFPVNIPGLEN